jgi:hypothetical protein
VNSRRKEVIAMKYEKPEVVRVASALAAVQNTSDKGPTTSNDLEEPCTASAYAADE